MGYISKGTLRSDSPNPHIFLENAPCIAGHSAGQARRLKASHSRTASSQRAKGSPSATTLSTTPEYRSSCQLARLTRRSPLAAASTGHPTRTASSFRPRRMIPVAPSWCSLPHETSENRASPQSRSRGMAPSAFITR